MAINPPKRQNNSVIQWLLDSDPSTRWHENRLRNFGACSFLRKKQFSFQIPDQMSCYNRKLNQFSIDKRGTLKLDYSACQERGKGVWEIFWRSFLWVSMAL